MSTTEGLTEDRNSGVWPAHICTPVRQFSVKSYIIIHEAVLGIIALFSCHIEI